MRTYCLILFCSVLCFSLKGQDSLSTFPNNQKKDFYKTNYVEDLSSMINITQFIFKTQSTFTIKGNEGIDYTPNDGYNVGIRLQHKWLGIAFSYSPQKLQEDKKG